MKKLIVIFTTILALSAINVKASNANCETKYTYKRLTNQEVHVYMGNNTFKKGIIYMATLTNKATGKKNVAFCLDMGHATEYGDTYIKQPSSYGITDVMRRSYAYVSGITNFDGLSNQRKYIIAQFAIWLEQNGYYSEYTLKSSGWSAYRQYYCDNYSGAEGFSSKQECLNSDLVNKNEKNLFELAIDQYLRTEPYAGRALYIYKSTTNSNYQRFLTDVPTDVCPPDYTPEQPPTESCGGVMQVVPSPPVCSLDNQTNSGYYTEEVVYEPGVCGTANEFGEQERVVGSYCKLYCKESVEINYPGGISSPISLGTSFVWPTSVATEHTIWGNLYSLNYRGTKTCKLKVDREAATTQLSGFAKVVQNNRYTYDFVRTRYNGDCNAAFAGEISSAQNVLNNKQTNLTNATNAYNSVKSGCDSASAKYKDAYKKCNDSKNACETFCKNNTFGDPTAYRICMDTCNTSACDSVASLNNQMISACQGLSAAEIQMKQAQNAVNSAQTAVTTANNKVTACRTYINAYNSARQVFKEIENCANTSFNANDLYHFQSSTSVSYNDPEYGNIYDLKGSTYYSCTNCDYRVSIDINPANITTAYLNTIMNKIEERNIDIYANSYYSLPDNLYHYIDKKTNKPLMSPIGEYINVGYSNLPTSFNANVSKKYNLSLIVNSLGDNGRFTEAANQNPYVCHYSVAKTPTDECVCPEGTKHAGEDLYCKIYSAGKTEETMTCADAQVLYCNSDEKFDEICSDEKFCPNDKSIKITSCLNNGYSYNYCVDNLCNGNKDYHCPKGTYNDGMNIKPCVFANIGLGLDKAINYCVNTVCPAKGINIIYRPISLRNPFPGKEATGSTVHFNLDHISGRHPGANWNSQLLVKNQILYNRNVEGNQVYNKEPLYSFILDGNTIRQIRSYNDSRESSGGYADFTLDCNSSGIACLSNKFLRESVSGLVGGVCKSSSSSNFYACSES